MASGTMICAALVLVIVIVLAALMLYATTRHKRYIAALGPLVANDPVLKNTHLPSLTLQDRAYAEAQMWVTNCKKLNIVTWVAGPSRASLLDVGRLYPWESTITFWYVSARALPAPKLFSDGQPSRIILKRDSIPPAELAEAKYGPLEAVPHAVIPHRRLVVLTRGITLPRRDVLDWFRFPPATSDTVFTQVGVEI